jgi:hypothetical protein
VRLDHLLLSKDSIVLSGVFTKYLHSENHVGQADVRVPFGALAQLGEHLLCKQGVVGSIPTGSTILGCVPESISGSVAQVVRAHP